ncbi:C4b-binding protein alpha chain-like isoform X1 [Leucoraja erinacea]|uniref:C4b-binding protein alpha chain-like isoform X1 n=1 Tax=Leucoraja erinaceus TaxID=7782 RepID=UPI0024540937|nr:C4b-binding protein alpha chain-like isoform X1 [Leucoraja erinacea]
MVGSADRLCEAQGWSGQVPNCDAIKCVAPPAIDSGSVSDLLEGDFWEYGMVATYSCHSSYTLIGEKEIACSASGNWSHPPPICKVVKCYPPKIPANSKVSSGYGFHFKYGQAIRYTCEVGFAMIGSKMIECSADNKFHPDPPTCNLTGCYPPHDIDHGRIENKQSIYAQHATVKYICQWGYKLTGNETIMCTGKNKFDAPVPTCQLISCDRPSSVYKGRFTPDKDWYDYRDEVTFSCNTGYRMVGRDSSRCGQDGTFHPPPPRCEKVPCDRPSSVHKGRFTPDKDRYVYGDEVTFSCNTGYRMVGRDSSRCGQDGTFHPPPPRCEAVPCYRPSSSNEKRFTPDKGWYVYGDEVTFSCNTGYRMVGWGSSRCNQDGTFHPPPPRCEKESYPKGILTIQDLMKVILPKAGDIMEEMKSIIKLEHQLLQKEENIIANFREIFQLIEQFVNSTSITY